MMNMNWGQMSQDKLHTQNQTPILTKPNPVMNIKFLHQNNSKFFFHHSKIIAIKSPLWMMRFKGSSIICTSTQKLETLTCCDFIIFERLLHLNIRVERPIINQKLVSKQMFSRLQCWRQFLLMLISFQMNNHDQMFGQTSCVLKFIKCKTPLDI